MNSIILRTGPDLFNDLQEDWPSNPFSMKAKGCRLNKNATRFYSPKLNNVWSTIDHEIPNNGDWFTNEHVKKKYFVDNKVSSKKITSSYCHSLDLLQIAAATKKALLPWREQVEKDRKHFD
jgi:hypothetical protein